MPEATTIPRITDEQLRAEVDEFAALTQQADAIKERLETLKAHFEKRAVEDLKDTKMKSVSYWGSSNCRVVVQTSETVKPVSVTMIQRVLGDVAKDFVKEEVTTKLTDPCKRLLGMVFQGNYTEGSLDELISAITSDAKIQATLKKRLKGRWEKDTAALMKVAGLSEQEASDYAYMAVEVINWEWLAQVLKSAGWAGSIQEAIEVIRAAVIVDESIQITLLREKDHQIWTESLLAIVLILRWRKVTSCLPSRIAPRPCGRHTGKRIHLRKSGVKKWKP